MKVVGYLRVSTREQAQHGLGLDVQERALRRWARAHGHRLVACHTDAGVSGTSGLDARTGLGDALADLKAGRASALVVYRLDRLARDLVVQETILSDVWRHGAEVFSTASGEQDLRNDPDDPSRKLIRQVLGAVAEYERDMTVLRMAAGRRRKAERGGYAYGAPGYGHKATDGALRADKAEQAAVTRMVDLRAEGASLRTICATLTDEGHRTKRSGRWQPNTVRRILARQDVAA